jgi:hypothetical protein
MGAKHHARLDTDRTAKPLTEIKAKVQPGKCVSPAMGHEAYTYQNVNPHTAPVKRLSR